MEHAKEDLDENLERQVGGLCWCMGSSCMHVKTQNLRPPERTVRFPRLYP